MTPLPFARGPMVGEAVLKQNNRGDRKKTPPMQPPLPKLYRERDDERPHRYQRYHRRFHRLPFLSAAAAIAGGIPLRYPPTRQPPSILRWTKESCSIAVFPLPMKPDRRHRTRRCKLARKPSSTPPSTARQGRGPRNASTGGQRPSNRKHLGVHFRGFDRRESAMLVSAKIYRRFSSLSLQLAPMLTPSLKLIPWRDTLCERRGQKRTLVCCSCLRLRHLAPAEGSRVAPAARRRTHGIGRRAQRFR